MTSNVAMKANDRVLSKHCPLTTWTVNCKDQISWFAHSLFYLSKQCVRFQLTIQTFFQLLLSFIVHLWSFTLHPFFLLDLQLSRFTREECFYKCFMRWGLLLPSAPALRFKCWEARGATERRTSGKTQNSLTALSPGELQLLAKIQLHVHT